nr:DNA repair protein RAD51 homolog 3 [Tanacetum cinerariifolium]
KGGLADPKGMSYGSSSGSLYQVNLLETLHKEGRHQLKISETEALEILKSVSNGSALESTSSSHTIVNGAQSAWDMLQEEEVLVRITTSCADLDNILGGGISCKEVTEIGGVPGIGKTQLGIQLAVNVQIPYDYGGLGGKAIYIDTEGSFMVERALQIAEACSDNMAEYSRTYRKGKFITEHKGVKVVIVDSITFHFCQDFDDMASRTRVLGEMALKLMKLARKFGTYTLFRFMLYY